MRAAVIHSSLNFLGGASKVCLSFIRALSKAGCDITLFTVDRTDWDLLRKVFGDFYDLNFKERFLFAGFPRVLHGTMFRKLIIAMFYLLEVLVIRFFGDFDLVLVTGGELIDSFGDIVYVNAIPIRFAHSFSDVRLGKSTIWNCYSKLYDILLRFIGKIDSKGILLTNSSFLRKIIKKFLGRDSVVIHPPVDVEKLMNSNDYNEGERQNLVVTISRLHPGKSLEVILKIAKLVDEAKFLIIGSISHGSEGIVNDLKSSIDMMGLKDRVDLLINKPFKNLIEALYRAKVLLHAQTSEAFGMVVVEAMAAGCIPVVPLSGGPWIDILGCSQGLYGFSYRNVNEAAEIIKKILRDENLRCEVAARARARALNFDKSVFEKKVLEVVNRFIEGKRGGGD